MTRAGLPAVRLGGAAALALLALGACGYTTRPLDQFPSARTVAVLPFTYPGYRRDVDLRLMQAVVREIRARTSYGFASPETADLLLDGTMDVSEAVTLENAERRAVEKRVQGGVRVRVRDRRSGRVLKTYRADDTTDYVPDRFGETLEGFGYDEWTRRVAVRVVQGLEADL